ncbi:MAG TPA: hypothetical protein VK465_11615, partial [Fibrobacteria bacterium]|nr:hypothetical protein [Fibrobacteria bacterium]
MTMSTKTLSIDVDHAYLLTGYLNPQKSHGDPPRPKSGTLVPIADRFFAYLNQTHQETIGATDARGRLRSFNSKLEPLPIRQYIVTHPMRLVALPQGLARQAFFANLEDWQKVLVEEIRGAKLKHAHHTIPFQFEKKDLKKPEEEDEAGQEAHASFKEGVKYRGHLFPRVQAVVFLVPAEILVRGKYKVSLLKDGKVVTTFTEFGHGRKRTFETVNSLTQAPEKTEYVCFSHASTDGSLAEGFHALEIPGSALRTDRFPTGSPILARGLRFGCDVKFSLHSLYGDFDYHVLTPVSVESALLSNFPDTFAHVRKALFTPGVPGGGDGGSGGGESGGNVRPSRSVKTTLKSWAEGYEWVHAKRQMALGYLNAENDERMRDLFDAVLGVLDDVETEALRSSAQVVKTFWGAGRTVRSLGRDLKRITESFKILKEHKDKLRLVSQAVDGNFFTRAFKETRWQRYILEELREAEKLRKDGKAVTNK